MDLRGQVSAEFLLIASFILIIVLVFSSIAGPQSQENSIAASAKEGLQVLLRRSLTPTCP